MSFRGRLVDGSGEGLSGEVKLGKRIGGARMGGGNTDARHCVVSSEVMSIGTLTSSLVHPREVFKGAFLANAAAIICAHNHPSGDSSPSVEDRALCDRIRDAGKLLGVPMLDFLIVSDTDSWSGREHWSH